MYKLKIVKDMRKLSDEFDFEDEIIEKTSYLEIIETDEFIEIDIKEEEKEEETTLVEELERIFNNLKFSKENFELLNKDEIHKKWISTKKDNIFKRQDRKTVITLLELTKYFDDKDFLGEIVKTFSFIPILLYFYKNKDIENTDGILKIGSVMINDDVDFEVKLTKKEDEDKEYTISGIPPLNFGITDYRINLKNFLNVKASQLFYPKPEIKGDFIYGEHLEKLYVEILVTSRDDMRYIKTIEILEVWCLTWE